MEPALSPQGPLRCGILGCGTVADEYATTLAASPLVRLVTCADRDLDRARNFASRHQIPLAAQVERLLTREHLDLVVVLTPPDTHVALARQAVAAGIAVYVEKPLGLRPADTAALLADAERTGVRVGAAPDTFLAPPTQAARAAMGVGALGAPVAAEAALLSPGPECWHPTPETFYAPGAGPLGDMAPCYLATLVHLLGPITHVDAAVAAVHGPRVILTGPRAGTAFHPQAPTHTSALLHTAGGIPVTFTASFDIPATVRPHLEIYGTNGTLVLPDPNFYEGLARIRQRGKTRWRELIPPEPDLIPVGRGIGVLDLARAILDQRRHQATGHLAHHVVELIHAINRAAVASLTHTTSGAAG